jgi:hypothetical protein
LSKLKKDKIKKRRNMPVLKRIAVLNDLGQLSFSRQQLRVTRQNRADEQWG